MLSLLSYLKNFGISIQDEHYEFVPWIFWETYCEQRDQCYLYCVDSEESLCSECFEFQEFDHEHLQNSCQGFLTKRLKLMLPSTVASNQLAFVHDRQITGLILIANEIVDYWKCRKKRASLSSLKTFDKLNSDFFLSMLHLRRFSYLSISYSIMLNGKPRGFIQG